MTSNRCTINQPKPDADYTPTPTHVRVYRTEWPDLPAWTIDAADDDGNYTESEWYVATQTDAISSIPAFLADLRENYGVTLTVKDER